VKNKFILILFITTLFGSATVFASNSLSVRTKALERQVSSLKSQISQMQGSGEKTTAKPGVTNGQLLTLVEMYAHGPAVVTSPGFGLRRGLDEHELMVHLSGINKDLYVLKLRQKMDNYANEHGIAIPRVPIIVLSGGVEGQLVYDNNDGYSQNSKTDVNLSRAQLDVYGEVGPWATATMIINYDDGAGDASVDGDVARSSNSRLRIDRAFLTIGQLNKCPVYFSIGQMNASFGGYGSYMVTTPGTRSLGKMTDRMAILGYTDSGLSAQVYGFAGETKYAAGAEALRHGGVNVEYKYGHDDVTLSVNAGVMGNLAESNKMQDKIFGVSTAAETITSRVLGYNGRAKLSLYDFDLSAEYVGASKSFETTDLAFNGHGAKPQALQFESAYSFKIKDKVNTVFAAFGMTSQALALALPKQSFSAGYSIAPLKNTLASIEYRHDVNYGWNDTATSTDRITEATVSGRHSNTVTMQVGVYF
jgi:hypothetical protein